MNFRYSQIVDSHFFRGRFSAHQTQANEKLYAERAFDDVLMNEGVTTHYLPIPGKTEKGIDVWLSLEAFELAVYKRYNILVLIAGDSDFVPLIRKVNSLGARVMLLGWDFEYTDQFGKDRKTVTSIRLINEVTYPVMMHNLIDDKSKQNDQLINGLFLEEPRFVCENPINQFPSKQVTEGGPGGPQKELDDRRPIAQAGERVNGSIFNLKNGFGFIRCSAYPENVFFHFSSLINRDFSNLKVGDKVTFSVIQGEKGPVAQNVEVVES